MLKRLTSVLLVLAIVFSLAACSNSDKGGASNDNGEAKGDLVSGLWKANAQIDLHTLVTKPQLTDELADESVTLVDALLEIESDKKLDVFVEFNNGNYELKYELDSFKTALKEYYKPLFVLFKEDRDLFELVYNLDFVVIETMLINSNFNSYGQIVDHYESQNANVIDKMDNDKTLASVAPGLAGAKVKDGYVVVKGNGYSLDGNNLTVKLDKQGKTSISLTVAEEKIEPSSAFGEQDTVLVAAFKNGLKKVEND